MWEFLLKLKEKPPPHRMGFLLKLKENRPPSYGVRGGSPIPFQAKATILFCVVATL